MRCASHRWWCGVLGHAVNVHAPCLAVLRHWAPSLKVRRDARAHERLVQRVAGRALRPAVRARVADPSGEKLARGAFGALTGDVSGPTDLALLDVDVDRLQSQSSAQLRSAATLTSTDQH